MVDKEREYYGDDYSPSKRMRFNALRGGPLSEVSSFLTDLNNAYVALELFDHDLRRQIRFWRQIRRYGPRIWSDFGIANGVFESPIPENSRLPPSKELILSKVNVNSPGWWEVVGQLNPLQQIREFLNDLHRRRQDRDFREPAEKRRLELENEVLLNKILRERLELMRMEFELTHDFPELDLTREHVTRLVWQRVGSQLGKLADHQANGLIGDVEEPQDQSGLPRPAGG